MFHYGSQVATISQWLLTTKVLILVIKPFLTNIFKQIVTAQIIQESIRPILFMRESSWKIVVKLVTLSPLLWPPLSPSRIGLFLHQLQKVISCSMLTLLAMQDGPFLLKKPWTYFESEKKAISGWKTLIWMLRTFMDELHLWLLALIDIYYQDEKEKNFQN